MSNLVDTNRLEFHKIFEAHQQKNTITFTDALKICTTLKIFPDLLTSQEIRKIFVTLTSNESAAEKMTFLQFESFIKIIGKQAFRMNKKRSEDCGCLIKYIKEQASQRYGTCLEVSKQKSASKPAKAGKRDRNTGKSGQKSALLGSKHPDLSAKYKSPTKLSIPKISAVINLLSPSIKSLKKRMESLKPALTERKDDHISACSTSPSPNKPNILSKVSKIFANFQSSMSNLPKSNFKAKTKLKSLLASSSRPSPIILKLSFNLWRLSIQ